MTPGGLASGITSWRARRYLLYAGVCKHRRPRAAQDERDFGLRSSCFLTEVVWTHERLRVLVTKHRRMASFATCRPFSGFLGSFISMRGSGKPSIE